MNPRFQRLNVLPEECRSGWPARMNYLFRRAFGHLPVLWPSVANRKIRCLRTCRSLLSAGNTHNVWSAYPKVCTAERSEARPTGRVLVLARGPAQGSLPWQDEPAGALQAHWP
jgi:hypothetical protein